MSKWIKPVLLITAVVTMAVVSRVFGLDQKLGQRRDWIGAQGAWGPLIFAGVYALAAVAAIPGSILTIAAGTLFGSVG